MQNVAELHKYGYCKIDREWNSRMMSGLTYVPRGSSHLFYTRCVNTKGIGVR